MSETERCSWCGAETVEIGSCYADFACGSWRARDDKMWYRGEKCKTSQPQPPPLPPIPPQPQPASDRQELIRRFAVAIAGGHFASKTAYDSLGWADIWTIAVELANAEPRE
jgi:hypothetical protein